ncbi:hypothetical protein [Morganella morganii]|uniref:Uncharacterized protein n=1 Tax=bacterium 19GA11TI05 TaxID=2920688 RepID=A0AAU6TQW5_UNCXX|nr:hypothetical protein [Morganella morganii]MBT0421210.1 hypothetical protein [Morganella morganii subsp. morganii]MBT0515847.1 hypothetical protein [Morganella morganii subsp. morganii]MDW7795025.1 hypothetical protein [Morganella morganii]MRE59068.1 hypothetical protein [Morganella morganii]QWM05505.1 hypothetical protein IZ185_07345 [Morganella morganii subsp. morganii]
MLLFINDKRRNNMPNKIFSPKYNPVERVAFDMALALASKIELVNTPAQLMAEIAALYPECYKAADNQRKREYLGSHVKLHSVG